MSKNDLCDIKKYVDQYFEINKGSHVVFTTDVNSDSHVVKLFKEAVELSGSKVVVLICDATLEPYRSVPDRFLPKIMNSSYWIDFTDQMAVHSKLCKNFVKKGGNFLLLPGLSYEGLQDSLFRQNINQVLVDTREASAQFRKKGTLKITSEAGTNIKVSLMNEKISFSRVRELMEQKGKEVMYYGYALISINFDDMEGELVVPDYIWPPNEIKLVKEPLRMKIKNGKIDHIYDGLHATKLREWFERFNDPNVYKITHLTLGTLSGLKLSNSLLLNERIKGALTFGFGNVWSGKSPTHTDMVVLDSSIRIDEFV